MRRPFTVAVDFDGTIHDPENREPGRRMGKPFPGAKETLERLKDLGAHIVIHTCRARSPQGVPDPDPALAEFKGGAEHVERWLDFFEMPYDEVTAVKPLADCYVDDRAIPFDGDWHHAEREILSFFYMGVRA